MNVGVYSRAWYAQLKKKKEKKRLLIYHKASDLIFHKREIHYFLPSTDNLQASPEASSC